MKRWKPQKISGLLASIALTSCGTSVTPVPAQPLPLPAALAVPCPQPVDMMNNHADSALVALKEMYDLYGQCGGRLVELINYLQKAPAQKEK